MKNQLISITLHDSYFKGVTTTIECSNHTNNIGKNGAGKTSTLHLIPIFYGFAPNKLIVRGTNNLSFVDYYLPRPQSMIVYEYRKEDALNCVVLYRRGNEGYDYIFIKGGIKDVFNAENMASHKELANTKEWLNAHIKKTTQTSRPISTIKDYRAILFNDKKVLNKSRQKGTGAVQDAYEFSLCASQYAMQHIDKLSSVLTKKDNLYTNLEQMVLDAFLANQIDIASPPDNPNSDKDIDELKVLQKLQTNKKHYTKMRDDASGLKYLENSLKSLFQHIHADYEQAKKEHADLTAERIDKKNTYIIAKSSCDTELERLKTEIQELGIESGVLDKKLDKLAKEKEHWDSLNIIEKQSQLDNIADYQAQAENAAEHYNNLLNKVDEEKNVHELKKAETNAKMLKQVETLNAKINDQKAQIEIERAKAQRAKDTIVEETKSHKERVNANQETERTTAQHNINQRNEELNNINGRFTIEQTEQLTASQIAIDAIQDKIDQMDEPLNDINEETARLDEQFQKAHVDLLSAQNTQRTIQANLVEIEGQIHPIPNTLREYMQNHVPQWENTIGKVINPKLLDHTKLNPEFDIESNADDIFGLTINHAILDIPSYALTKQELEKEKAKLETQEKQLIPHIDDLEKHIQKIDSQRKELATQKVQLTTRISNIKREKTTAKQSLEKLKNTFTEHNKEQASQLQNQIDELNTAFIQLKASHEEQLKRISREEREAKLRVDETLSHTLEPIETKIDTYTASIDTAKQDYKRQLKALNDAFDALLADREIDVNVIHNAKQEKEDSEALVDTVKGYREDIEAFTTWEQASWSSREDDETRLAEIRSSKSAKEKELQQQERVWTNIKTSYQAEKNKLDEAIDDLDKYIAQNEEEQEALQASIDRIVFPETPVEIEYSDKHSMLLNAKKQRKAIREKRTSLKKHVEQLRNYIVGSNTQTEIKKVWEGLCTKRAEISEFEIFDDEFALQQVDDLVTLYETSIPAITQLSVNHIRTVCDEIQRFYHSLGSLSQKVNRISKTLSENINTEHSFQNIGEINMGLHSKIDDYHIMSELQTFDKLYTDWQVSQQALPSDRLLYALRTANSALSASKIKNDRSSLVGINLEIEINGIKAKIKDSTDFSNVSSTGLTTIAIIVIFCGLTRYLCHDPNVEIHWPLDELGVLDDQNLQSIFEYMSKKGIILFCAQPSLNPITRKLFVHKNQLIHGKGVLTVDSAQDMPSNPLLTNALGARA